MIGMACPPRNGSPVTFRIGLEAPKGWPKCDGVHTSAVDRARNAIGNQAAWGYVIRHKALVRGSGYQD